MDGMAAIQDNLEALKRILAGLCAMAGFGQSAIGSRRPEASATPASCDCPLPAEDCRPTLPRHLRLAILRLLRPAESAARRLIIAAARGLTVTLPPTRPKAPASLDPAAIDPAPLLRRFGIAVVLPAGADPILPRPRVRGTTPGVLPSASPSTGSACGGSGLGASRPDALASGVPRTTTLPLFDPPRRLRASGRRRVAAVAAPRILFPGVTEPSRLPPPPAPDDPVDCAHLACRLAALAAALDDLPGQARRFARWQARRKAGRPGNSHRITPLRPGRPPGGRLSRFGPPDGRDALGRNPRRRIREVDEILAHAHALAVDALRHPDTS